MKQEKVRQRQLMGLTLVLESILLNLLMVPILENLAIQVILLRRLQILQSQKNQPILQQRIQNILSTTDQELSQLKVVRLPRKMEMILVMDIVGMVREVTEFKM